MITYIKQLKRLWLRHFLCSNHSTPTKQALYDQAEDVLNGKPVIGEQKDIQEVKNAYEAYEQIVFYYNRVEDNS